MASAPQQLPLFYNGLEPLSSELHADYRIRPADSAMFAVNQHAVPVTVDEFTFVQRHMPIVFAAGNDSVPLALMGLNEGVNLFINDEGKLHDDSIYVPAYIRRHPFMLARLRPDATELSLCFDPTSETVGRYDDGDLLFVDGQPSEMTQNILQFNQQFEQAGARTGAFIAELKEMDLLMEGEVTIQHESNPDPFVYRGFMMVNEEKLLDLRGDQLRKMSKSGMLPLIYAHLMSLTLMRDLFARQMKLGKVPRPNLN